MTENQTEKQIETLILLLCKIPQLSLVRAACRDQLGIPEKKIEKAISSARRQITVAADYHRDSEIGKAIIRYEDLYHQAYKAKELKLALNAEKARVALLGLSSASKVEVTEKSVDAGVESVELESIRQHLEPLDLAPVGTSLPELARLAALKITEQ
jgi:hypothetical protein